jgi:ubiquitin carboxyl-terminal hydrolase 1
VVWQSSCRLEDCLEDYTRLEILKDCICRKCSLVATLTRLQKERSPLEAAVAPPAKASSSKKKRLKEVRKMEGRVKAALEEGRIEDDLKDVRIEKVFSTASTKQAMIARPPPVLALHLNRSIHYGSYVGKNNCRVFFPEVLDLTPYTTSGSLSTIPTASISTPPPSNPLPRRSTTPTPSLYRGMEATRTIYRLSAVVCHFGTHSFGHYICYRRKPTGRTGPPKLIDPLLKPESNSSSRISGKGKGVEVEGDGEAEGKDGQGEADEEEDEGPQYVWEDGSPSPGTGWLRISDDSVRECGIETVLTEGSSAFMLYYELAIRDPAHVYPSLCGNGLGEMGVRGGKGAEASEETLKPEMRAVYLNGSVGSLVSEVGVGIQKKKQKPEPTSSSISASPSVEPELPAAKGLSMSVPSMGLAGALTRAGSAQARVVRSVAAGRGRSTSVQPTSSTSSIRAHSAGPSNVGASSSTSSPMPIGEGEGELTFGKEGSASTLVVMEGVNGSAGMSASVPALSSTALNGALPTAKTSPKKKNKGPSKPSGLSQALAAVPSLSPKTPLSTSSDLEPGIHAPLPAHLPTSPKKIVGDLES